MSEIKVTNDSDNSNISNTTNSSYGELVPNYKIDKINIKEIKPSIKYINENIYEEDLSFIIEELINIYLNDLNKGIKTNIRKKNFLDYINNNEINLQEMYYWLLNNQNNSYSIYLLGYFNYHGIETNINKEKTFELYQKAAKLENIVAQLDLAAIYIDERDKKNYEKAYELFKKLTEMENPNAINMLGYCYDYGFGIDVNKQKAVELYQKAADLGNSDALINLEIYEIFS
ncbi:hypothetical protein C1646_672286 [Rhizophagus diaphanus]|nr:hypothetical protein C1646_672286 [Rhizophagus diaphanus] [Rhizophagus sp. MUCL 43196]